MLGAAAAALPRWGLLLGDMFGAGCCCAVQTFAVSPAQAPQQEISTPCLLEQMLAVTYFHLLGENNLFAWARHRGEFLG